MVLSTQGFQLEIGSTFTEEAELLLIQSASGPHAPGDVDRLYVLGLSDRVRRGELDVITLLKGVETIGIIFYRCVDSEAEFVYCYLKPGHQGLERPFLSLIIDDLSREGNRVIRGSFSGPGGDRFALASLELGFRKVVRMSMTRNLSDGHILTYRASPGLDILQWSPAFFEEVCRLMWQASEDFDRAVYPMFGTPEGSRALLLSILQDRHGAFLPELSLIAQIEGQTVGFILSSMIHDGGVLILDIAVHPGYRRRGIGGKLLECLISKSALLGRRQIVLAVTLDNDPAIALYRKMGFRQAAIFDQYVLELGQKVSVQ